MIPISHPLSISIGRAGGVGVDSQTRGKEVNSISEIRANVQKSAKIPKTPVSYVDTTY